MNAGAVAIFVKTPGHSPLKTRLSAECGEAYAQAWYRRAATAVAAVVQAACVRCGIRGYWAVAEDTALGSGYWRGLDTIAQGEGGLGERMARVQAHLVAHHRHGLLVGADTPQLSARLLEEALWRIQSPQPRLVMGPAQDGGFWLFGANVAPPLAAWTRVAYSTARTAADFEASMAGVGRVHRLPMLCDVDRRADLREVLDALQRLPEPVAEQRALAEWMLEHEDVLT